MHDAQVEIRTYDPPDGGLSVMHIKGLIVDDVTYLGGSANMTENSLDRNKEHLFKITEPETVREVAADFEKLWELSQVIGPKEVEIMLDNREKREAKYQNATLVKKQQRRSFQTGARASMVGA